jgi:SAM-dependent methyltransferase
MNEKELKSLWQSEEQKAFSGWDFSHLDGRWVSDPLPWDYKDLILDRLKPSDRLLDMGTGGGEFLLSLNHPYRNTSVTEAWEPNVRLCRERLAPLGIGVHQVSDDAHLPFDGNTFDMVINRHESYDLSEVSRILKPGGLFITQQVGAENNRSLSERLIPGYTSPFRDFTLAAELLKFASHGFSIVYSNEALPELRYLDVGAVVYYAKIIEWEYPDFSVEKYFPQLCRLHGTCVRDGCIATREHRFVIVSQKRL